MALREIAGRHRRSRPGRRGARRAQGVRAAGSGDAGRGARARAGPRWQPGIDVPAAMRPGRHRRHRDRPGRAVRRRRRDRDRRRHRDRAVHRRDAGRAGAGRVGALRRLPRAVPARCAADRRRRRAAAPAGGAVGVEVVLGAAVPLPAHRPAGPGRGRPGADARRRRGRRWSSTPDALDALYAVSGGYPYFVQAYGKVTWDARPGRSPITGADVRVAAPEAEAELAVGFFGSRYERATPAERDYMRAMAALGDGPVGTAEVADSLGRKPASLSPGPRRADQEGPGLLRRSAARSPSPSRTSANTCAPNTPELVCARVGYTVGHAAAHPPRRRARR